MRNLSLPTFLSLTVGTKAMQSFSMRVKKTARGSVEFELRDSSGGIQRDLHMQVPWNGEGAVVSVQ